MSDSTPERDQNVLQMPTTAWAFGPFRFEVRTGRLYRGDAEIHLTPRASGVLRCLLERRDEVVSKDALFAEVWKDVTVSDDALLQVISTVRKVLGDDARHPSYIQTMTGEGYRFIAEVEEVRVPLGTPEPRPMGEAAPAPLSPSVNPGRAADADPSVDVERGGADARAHVGAAPGSESAVSGTPIESAPSLRVPETEGPPAHPALAAGGRPAPLWRRGHVGLAGVVLLIGIVALGWGLTDWFSLPRDTPGERASIAVLPFLNLSGDAAEEYFSDGLAEELVGVLGKIDGLRVAARTSSFAFKGQNRGVAEIAEQLGVAHVLEGSARRDGDRVRVTARLIDAADGFELWGQTYDRQLTDVFAIQQDIAARVAEALTVPLVGDSAVRVARLPTDDIDAYDAYLRGNHFLARYSAAAFRAAASNFERAIDIDPDFALAYAGLADAYLLQNRYGVLPLDEALAGAGPAVDRALQLDPRLGEAHAMRGLMLQRQGDIEGAQVAYERALELDPGSARTYQLYWWMMFVRQGNTERTLELARQALEADPLSPAQTENFGWPLFEAGRFDEARAYFERSIELEPAYSFGYSGLGVYYQSMGLMDEAIAAFEQAVSLSPETSLFRTNLGHALASVGRADDAIAQLEHAAFEYPAEGGLYGDVGEVHWDVRGRPDQAASWYRVAIDRNPGSPRLRTMLALVMLDLDDPGEAERWVASADAIDPDHHWSRIGRLNLLMYEGAFAEGAEFARRLAETTPYLGYLAQYDRPYSEYAPLGYFSLLAGRPDEAPIFATRAYPGLLDDDPAIDHFNVDAAIDLATIWLQTGDDGRAEQLLQDSLAFIGSQREDMRTTRYREQPAAIYALQGRVPEALAALRTAIDAGWRRGWWRAHHKPHYAALRNEPAFQAMLAELEAEAAAMRRALAAGDSGG